MNSRKIANEDILHDVSIPNTKWVRFRVTFVIALTLLATCVGAFYYAQTTDERRTGQDVTNLSQREARIRKMEQQQELRANALKKSEEELHRKQEEEKKERAAIDKEPAHLQIMFKRLFKKEKLLDETGALKKEAEAQIDEKSALYAAQRAVRQEALALGKQKETLSKEHQLLNREAERLRHVDKVEQQLSQTIVQEQSLLRHEAQVGAVEGKEAMESMEKLITHETRLQVEVHQEQKELEQDHQEEEMLTEAMNAGDKDVLQANSTAEGAISAVEEAGVLSDGARAQAEEAYDFDGQVKRLKPQVYGGG